MGNRKIPIHAAYGESNFNAATRREIRNRFSGRFLTTDEAKMMHPASLADFRADAGAGLNGALLAFRPGHGLRRDRRPAHPICHRLWRRGRFRSPLLHRIATDRPLSHERDSLPPLCPVRAFSAPDRLFYLPMLVLFTAVLLVMGALFRAVEIIQFVSRLPISRSCSL